MVQPNTNLIERFHGTLKARIKVMRGLKKPETALEILDGWLVHYNFFRPHESLGDTTPAEKAGIKFPFKNWLDVVIQSGVDSSEKAREIEIYFGEPTRYGIKRKPRIKKGRRRKAMPVLTSVQGIRS